MITPIDPVGVRSLTEIYSPVEACRYPLWNCKSNRHREGLRVGWTCTLAVPSSAGLRLCVRTDACSCPLTVGPAAVAL